MSELHGAAVTDENGELLSSDDLADLLSTADKVEFWFEKLRGGKVARRAKISIDVDTDGIGNPEIAQYRRDVSKNAIAQQELRAEAIELGFLDEEGKETTLQSPEKTKLSERLTELSDDFNRIVATLVAHLVVSDPIAGKDLRDPVVLCEREGIGPVAREALFAYFFGDLSEPEAETGKDETPNSETRSGTTEATETGDDSPATS